MNYIKNLASFLILGLIITSCGQKHNITAEIEGFNSDTIFVFCQPFSKYGEGDSEPDTIIATNGKFTFDTPSTEPIFIFISQNKREFYDKRIVLVLKPNEHIYLKAKLNKYYVEYQTKGSDLNDEFCRLRSTYIKEKSQNVKISLQIDSITKNKGDRDLISKLFKKRNEYTNIRKPIELKFIKNNWNKNLSAYLLIRQPLDTLGKYYDKLNTEIKEGIFKNILEYKYLRYKEYVKVREAEKNIIEGKIAPNFSLQSLSGKEFSLNSINDKYVVLDFWGSWCGGCIQGFPKMKEYYNKYKNKIEFIGIDCNDTEEKWKNAVEKYKLDWLQVINKKNTDKNIAIIYGIQVYPTKIILDKNKKILAKFYGEGDDFYKKLDELLKK